MKKIISLASRLIRELRKNGMALFLQKLFFYKIGKGRMLWALDGDDWKKKKKKAKGYFSLFPIGSNESLKPKIVFLLPGVWISGGIAVALRHANLLKERGHNVSIVTQDFGTNFSWYKNQNVEVIPIHKIEPLLRNGIDVLIATGWNSAPTVDLLPAKKKVYLIQLDERRFYDDRALQEFVGETYKLPFTFIVIAKWMKQWLLDEFKKESFFVPNGLDQSIFRPADPLEQKKDRPRILIEGPIDIPFKGVSVAYSAVKDLDCDIWIVSSHDGELPPDWNCGRFFSKVPLHEMPKIYSSCDILLKMSSVESFSYPPLEMMACGGVPVILKVSGIEEYALHEENCLIVHNQEEATQAVKRLLSDPQLRAKLSKGGIATAQEWSWDRSALAMESALFG